MPKASKPSKDQWDLNGQHAEPPEALRASLPERSHLRLLKLLAVFTATLGFLVSVIVSLAPFPYTMAAPVLAFACGAIVFRWFPAPYGLTARRNMDQIRSEVRQLEEELEVQRDTAWELREADDRHRSVLEALGAMVIRRDAAGRVLYVNDAVHKVFKREDCPQIGAPLTLPTASLHINEHERDVMEELSDIPLETREGVRWFSRLNLSIRDGSGDAPIIQTILRDITPRRQAEARLREDRDQAASASEAKSRFLAMVSHEIRTPLNGILGMTGLLEETRLTPEQRNYLEAVHTSGEALRLLIEEILDYSKIEAGRLEIYPEETDIRALIERSVELLAPRAHEKGLEIGAFIEGSIYNRVNIDGPRLRQILFNLIGNAIKFTEEGGVSVEAIYLPNARTEQNNPLLQITVADSGPGFDSKDAARLFNEFEQGEEGRARKHGGTGLGLSISRRLADLMGGSLKARSTPGKGADFILTLPVEERARGEKPPLTQALSNNHLAIVTDKTIEAATLKKDLEQAGAHVDILPARTPDLDDLLAGVDGILLDYDAVVDPAGWIAAIQVRLPQARIIILVPPHRRDQLERLHDAGAGAYLIRPVRGASLVSISHSLLRDGGVSKEDLVAAEAPPKERQPKRKNVRGKHFLVAEDNEINRLLTEALLRKMGYEATIVPDGIKALEAFKDGSFDAMLMDLHMPGLDGLEAIRRIREMEKHQGGSIPIIAVTADAMPEAREAAHKAGADGFITKPLDPEALEELLDSVIMDS
ncbi:response regulator [Rhodobacteraceae bacterium RKSG542]|uniref:response regulator n=1 Tax=Pseudovibrio flavus TaxID=2529854 RepID=UPI0012BD3D90|nr:response regulator [Pseudovibrio flavus]MTI18529.1 response regulator [Pseudovibrio flavus]